MTPLAFPILSSLSLYFLVLVYVAWQAFAVRKASVMEPIGQYLFFLTLFVVPLPLRLCYTMDIEGDVSSHLLDFANYVPIAIVCVAISLPFFLNGYFSNTAERMARSIPTIGVSGATGGAWGVAFVVTLSTGLVYQLTQEAGGILPFLLLGYKSSEAAFGRGYLAVGFPWLIVANVALLDCYATSRRLSYLVPFALLLVVNVLIEVMTGNRSLILYLGAVIGTFVHFRIRRLTFKMLLPVMVAGFLALNILGGLRGSEYSDLEDLADRTSQSADSQSEDRKNLFYTLTVGEFVVPFETLPQMIRTVGVTKWPWFGLSLARLPTFLIPSALFPDRPLPLANWYMENFYGGGLPGNEGRAFFYLSEGYLNFGLAGLLGISWLWGGLWGALHRWMLRGTDRFGTVLVYALLVGFMFRCVAGDIVTLFIATTQQSVVGALIIIFISRGIHRWRTARHSVGNLS